MARHSRNHGHPKCAAIHVTPGKSAARESRNPGCEYRIFVPPAPGVPAAIPHVPVWKRHTSSSSCAVSHSGENRSSSGWNTCMVGWNFRPFRPSPAARRISFAASGLWGSTLPNPISTPGYSSARPASQSLPIHDRPVTVSSSQSRTTPRMSREEYSSAISSIDFLGTCARKYASVASRCGPIDCCSHCSVGRWTCRSIARTGALFPVVVEALARLPAEVAGLHHLLQKVRRGVDRILELLVQDVGDRVRGVDTDQVEQRQRTHGMPEPERHSGLHVLLGCEA